MSGLDSLSAQRSSFGPPRVSQGGSPGGEPAVLSSAANAMAMLHGEIKALQDELTTLAMQLQPALAPEPPTKGEGNCEASALAPPWSPLVCDLRRSASDIAQITGVLRSLRERLDL